MKKTIATAIIAAALTVASQMPAQAGIAGIAKIDPAPAAAQSVTIKKVGFKGHRFRIRFGHYGHRYYYKHRYYGCKKFYKKYKWTGRLYWLRRYEICKGWR